MIGRWSNTPPEEPAAEPKSFDDFDVRLGDVMRGERATLGKSLLDVQRELKIKATYIAAIENADPSAFETPGFVAGYVRSYARYLGMDPEWAYATFCAESGFATSHGMSAAASGVRPARQKPETVIRAASDVRDPFANPNTPFFPRGEAFLSRIEPGALGSSLVLLALIAGLGYGGWTVLQEVQRVQLAPVDQTPGVVSEVDPLAPATTVIAGVEADADAGIARPRADALDRLYRPQALDVPVMTARDGPIAALDPSSVGTLAVEEQERRTVAVAEAAPVTPPAPETAPVVQVVEDAAPEVVLFAVRPAWVRVRSADGTVLFEKILDAGERYTLPQTEEPPTLRAGNATSVYFQVAGQNYGPAGAGVSVVKNLSMAADDLTTAYSVADLTKDRDLARIVAEAQSTGN